VRGKQGFILPILITRHVRDIQASLRNSIFGSPAKRHLAPLLPKLEKYALALQSGLQAKFPEEFTIKLAQSDSDEGARADPIDLIHTLFLEKLDVYYRGLNR
jgi:hypothetical protein